MADAHLADASGANGRGEEDEHEHRHRSVNGHRAQQAGYERDARRLESPRARARRARTAAKNLLPPGRINAKDTQAAVTPVADNQGSDRGKNSHKN